MAITRVDSPEYAASLKAFNEQQTAIAQPNGMVDPLVMRAKLQSQGIPLANTDQQAADVLQQKIGAAIPTPTPDPNVFGLQGVGKAGPAIPTPVSAPPTPTPVTPIPQQNLYKDPYARSPEQIAQLARDRVQKILQAGRTSAQGALTGAKNANDYTNQIKGDDRTLRNFQFKNRNDPFSGNTSYMATNVQRNDSIQDTSQNKDYNAQVGLINQKLADLEAAAPGDEQAIIDQLQQIERTTGINVAQLQMQQQGQQFNQGMQTQQFNSQQQNQAFNQNLATNQFNSQLQNQQFNQSQSVKQQHIDLADKLTQQFGVIVKPTSDPMESYAQVAGLSTIVAQKLAEDVKQQGFENTIKYALANNTITQTQANIMHEAQQLSISQQNANTSSASQGNSANNAEQSRLMNVWQATGKAPKGIPGVAEGTPIYEKPTADKPKVVDYKTDPNFAADVAHLKSSPADAAKLDSSPEPFIKEYGYDGYLALRKAAGLD